MSPVNFPSWRRLDSHQIPHAAASRRDEPDEDEGVDPREELVRRLLEYQRYKDAAAVL